MSDRKNQVPAWYRVEEWLISNPLTRILLFNWLRVKKKYGTIREKRLARKFPECLMNFEHKVFSQHGEDGIIREIFNRVGTTDRFFVEFGIQNGMECCTRALLENQGWSGVWMEGSPEDAELARQNFARFPIKVFQRFVTAENIIQGFEEAGIPHEFDLLSIDVDGNDYWIWKAVSGRYSPRVLVVEYNATFGPRRPWVVPYDPNFLNDGTAFFGGSLESFARLGKERGYQLVGCDSFGVNAFFVRNDLVDTKFIGLDRPASFHYVAPHYDSWFGHPVRVVDQGIGLSPAEAGHLKPTAGERNSETSRP